MSGRTAAAANGPNPTANIDKVLSSSTHADGLVYGTAEVSSVGWVTPRMLRVTLTGPVVARLATGHANATVRLFVPDPDQVLEATEPTAELPDVARSLRQRARVYTIRHLRPADAEVDLDLVVHSGGLASDWARGARPGDRVLLAGPRRHAVPPFDAGEVLLLADATALPAVAAILEAAPAHARGAALVEIADAGERQEVAGGAPIEVTWVERDGGDSLVAAVQRLTADPTWSADRTVWVAGELGVARRLRTHLVGDRGVDPGRVQAYAYWRSGATATQLDEGRAAAVVRAVEQGRDPQAVDDLDVD